MTTDGTPTNRAARIKRILWRANKQVERAEIQHLKERGLCLSDFAILEVLLHKGPLPVNTIGQKVLLTSGSITSAIQRLEQKQLLSRTASPEDRRITLVSLTPPGREFIAAQFAAHLDCLEHITSVLTSEEADTLTALLKKLGLHAERLLETP